MAEAQDSVTTVDEHAETQKKGRFGFGRRKDKGSDRNDTEWVETLRAQEDAEPEDGPSTSPFAAPELPEPEPASESEPAPEPEAADLSGLPESHAETEPLSREAGPVSNGDTEQVYERNWTRRRHEEMDDIHHFVDNVLGTSLDPARRRRLMTQEVGLQNRTVERQRNRSAIQVEGIDEELMIAFTFPEEEFRGARVVYETEGGYVLEVQRAIGNDDTRMTHQYYTVSRVGEVAHVLDKMRAREMERDHAVLQRTVEADREAAVPERGPVHEPEPLEEAAPPAPETESAADTDTEALPETFREAEPEPQPEPEPVAAPEPHAGTEPEAVPEPPTSTDAPQVDVPPATAVPDTTDVPAPDEADEASKRRFGFGRKKGSEGETQSEAPAESETIDEADDRKRRFGFGRKRGDADEGDAAKADAPADADDSEAAKKRGIFRFKKGDPDAAGDEEDA